jgi:solute carrier family 25 (mitochondrial phosphate transporter), member 23/24/25/41
MCVCVCVCVCVCECVCVRVCVCVCMYIYIYLSGGFFYSLCRRLCLRSCRSPLLTWRAARLTVQGGVSQTQYRGIMHVLRDASQKEGVSVLFRGMVPTLLGVAPYVGVNYLVYETLKEICPRDESGRPNATWLGVCGAVAGTTGQTVAYPMDLLRRRFQVVLPDGTSMYRGVWDGLTTIVRKEGFLGLYKGFGPNFIKVVPTIAVMFWTNDMLLRSLKNMGY